MQNRVTKLVKTTLLLTKFLFLPFHPGLLSVSFPVVVSTWQFEDEEELSIRFSTCSNTLPSSISEPESPTKSYLYQNQKLKYFKK